MIERKRMMDIQVQPDMRMLKIALFWGSLWGIAEATLGHILHWISIPGLPGALLFPIGLYFMLSAFNDAGRTSAVFYTAVVAALIKCVNFFLPQKSIFSVANPVLAILCESLAVAAFLVIVTRRSSAPDIRHIWVTAFGWRFIYAAVVVGLGVFFTIESFLDLGPSYWGRFFGLESAANAFLIMLLFRIQVLSVKNISLVKNRRAFTSAFLFTAAVISQVLSRTLLK